MQCAYAVLSSVACSAVPHFPTLSHKRHGLRDKKPLKIKCVSFFTTILSGTVLILRRTERDMIKMYIGLHVNYQLLLSDFN